MIRKYLKLRKLKRKLAKLQLREKGLLYNVLYGEWEKTNPFFLSEHNKVIKDIKILIKKINFLKQPNKTKYKG